jgi:hypothetical protein
MKDKVKVKSKKVKGKIQENGFGLRGTERTKGGFLLPFL